LDGTTRCRQVVPRGRRCCGRLVQAIHREQPKCPPFVHFYLAAALAHLGRRDEARAAVQAGLALLPAFTIARVRAGAATDNPTYLSQRQRIYEGMRIAGIPEG
jgi:hypothetical protein